MWPEILVTLYFLLNHCKLGERVLSCKEVMYDQQILCALVWALRTGGDHGLWRILHANAPVSYSEFGCRRCYEFPKRPHPIHGRRHFQRTPEPSATKQ